MKQLWRNIAVISAAFAVLFAVLLALNQILYTSSAPLDMPAMTAMREKLDQDPANEQLQAEIRELDLLARKVYFTGRHQVETGTWILIFAASMLIISLRMLFARYKSLPDKDIDPFDAWIMQTLSRKYIMYGGVGTIACVLAFVFITQFPEENKKETGTEQTANSDSSNNSSVSIAENSSSGNNSEVPETSPSEETTEPTQEGELAIQGTENLTEIANVEPTTEEAGSEPTAAAEENAAAQVAAANIPKGPGGIYPNFRGNGGNGQSPARNIPVNWSLSSGNGILWKVPAPAKHGYSSPVVYEGKIYLTGADDESRELYCYNLTDGKLLWTARADNIQGSPASMPATTEDTGLAASSPATNGKQVCAIFASGDIICTDSEGKRLWAKNMGVPDNHYGHSSSLIMSKGMVYVQMDNNKSSRLIALDVATGAEKWAQTRNGKISWASPVIVNTGSREEIITTGNPFVISSNPNTGEQYWQTDCMSAEVGPSIAYAAGVVIAGNEHATMVGLNASDGTKLWETHEFLPEVSSPVATSTDVYIATSYGIIAAYDLKTGELGNIHEFDAQFYSSPIIADGKLFVMDTSGVMYVLNANTEFEMVKKIETGEKTYTTPAILDGKIIIRSENSLYCAGI